MKTKPSILLFLQLDYWFFVLALVFVAWLWQQSILLTFLLLILLMILLKDQDKKTVVYAMITGFLGLVAEIIAIYFGAWQYTEPQWLGIPFWLFFLWALAGMFFRRIQIDLKRFIK